MGYKKVCFQCCKAYSIFTFENFSTEHKCPQCGLKATVLNHKFRAPKLHDKRGWDLAKYLVDHGFLFDHISDNGLYVQYPATMEEAEMFIIKYKRQAYVPTNVD